VGVISVWFLICAIGFTWLGIFGSEYMHVGPSETLTYMGMKINTLARYLTVVAFVVISTAINDFASDAISPWIQNTVMDHKSQTIPYNKFTVIFIAQTWALYCGTMSVAAIALVFAQFDLILIRLIVDLFVNQYTIRRFLINKTHDPYRYHTEFLNETESELSSRNVDDYIPRDTDVNFGPRIPSSAELRVRSEPSVDITLDPRAQFVVEDSDDNNHPTHPKKTKKRSSGTV